MDRLSASSQSPSIDQIVSAVKQLQPTLAARRFNSYSGKELCSTAVYTSVTGADGQVVTLELANGKHAAGYVRVSTVKQRSKSGIAQGDGFSEDDQIERIVSFFIRKQMAFQLFSDCGLSGSLPTRDPTLMEKLWRRKARTYKSVFEAVFLDDRKYSPEEIEQMRGYMEAEVERIASGGKLAGIDDEDVANVASFPFAPSPAASGTTDGNTLDREALVFEKAVSEPNMLRHQNRSRAATSAKFRPALTIMVDTLPKIHTLALTDMSRLSRSDALFAELTDKLEQHQVRIEGVIESLAWMNDQDLGGVLTAKVLSVVSEFKIREVVLGSLRGILARLESGRPHGTLPFWLDRNDDGTARLNDKAELVRDMVNVFLADKGVGSGSGSFQGVTRWLASQKVKPPRGVDWSANSVTSMLRNPALIGFQYVFGKRWEVLPAVIDEEVWRRLRDKDEARVATAPKMTLKNPEGYLMTGLLRCRCGRFLAWHQRGKETPQYVCRAPASARENGERHVTLNANDVDSFFNELMQHLSAVFLRGFHNEEQLQNAKNEIGALEGALAELRGARKRDAAAIRTQAIAAVKNAYSLEDSDAEFESMVQMSERVLQRSSLRREQEVEVSLKEKRLRYAAMIHGDERAALEKQVLRWGEMTNREKRRILHRVFDTFDIIGDAPKERLSVRVHASYEMGGVGGLFPSITIRSTQYGKAIRRRLMTVAEYFEVLYSWDMMLVQPEVAAMD